MATTPTSMVNRLMGLESCTDGLQDAVLPAVAVAAATTTLSLTAALHAGKIVTLASTGGLIITPPAATGTFNVYTVLVIVTITGGSVTIDAKAGQASDVMAGAQYGGTSGTGAAAWPTASNSNLITWNGSTTGGLVGTCVQMIDVALHLWYVNGALVSSGTSATPFSNH